MAWIESNHMRSPSDMGLWWVGGAEDDADASKTLRSSPFFVSRMKSRHACSPSDRTEMSGPGEHSGAEDLSDLDLAEALDGTRYMVEPADLDDVMGKGWRPGRSAWWGCGWSFL